VFVPGRPFQPRLMFAGKARAYHSEAAFRYALLGKLQALVADIKQGWKDLPGINTLVYLAHS
jgi:hypothetical protein